MILVINSCVSELLLASRMISIAIVELLNDLRQIQYQDSLCIFRSYIGYVFCAGQFYSYLLQANYRYMTVVSPNRLLWQSERLQVFLIDLSWIFAFICTIPHMLTNEIQYYIDDQLCELPLHLSFISVYNIVFIYLLPMGGIIFIYFKLIIYVKDMSKRVTLTNTLSRAKRELQMVNRIIILVSIELTLGIPYTIFLLMGFISQPPKYPIRIAFSFVDVSLLLIMIALFQFTDPVKTIVMKKLNRQPHTDAVAVL
ncbi:unnamed protein product [Adineta steineri]|uniref:G-protein coupled receptors family 1 profile domain-containing protein n=1 Tax=Adineta steineri TaxID=433720 RepID=A0A813N4G3_9BILA|nr:unnamed protein product [Adineta steineri]CAF3765590.1 unnamed protein product [Adineta steineri]